VCTATAEGAPLCQIWHNKLLPIYVTFVYRSHLGQITLGMFWDTHHGKVRVGGQHDVTSVGSSPTSSVHCPADLSQRHFRCRFHRRTSVDASTDVTFHFVGWTRGVPRLKSQNPAGSTDFRRRIPRNPATKVGWLPTDLCRTTSNRHPSVAYGLIGDHFFFQHTFLYT